MKNRFLIGFFCVLLSACCAEKYQICEGYDTTYTIRFYNFNTTDIDSAFVTKYEASTNFSTALDSTLIHYTSDNSSFISATITKFPLEDGKDYIITLKRLNKIYKVSNISKESAVCKRCGEKKFSYSRLSSYVVDGSTSTNLYQGLNISK